MEAGVDIFDLAEGDMLTWPLNWPHRVENITHCVSVSAEYSSPESSFKNAVMYTNAVMRRRLNIVGQDWASMSQSKKMMKASIGRALRRFKLLEDHRRDDYVDFKVDASVGGFIRDIPPVARNF